MLHPWFKPSHQMCAVLHIL